MSVKDLSINNLVAKSNQIIEASYSLTVKEQRLLMACISQIDSRKGVDLDITKGFTLSVEQAQDLFYTNKQKKNAYADLKLACEKLFDRRLRLKAENGRYEIITRWISTVKFDNETMEATLYFHEQIKPFISQLGSNFTRYKLENMVQLTSVYAIRIYELIVSWSFTSSYKEMEISDLRELLDLGSKYKQHSEFNRYVINPALEQINAFTDFQLEITFKKRGRSFKWIQLRFNKKPTHKAIENAEPMHLDTLEYWENFRAGWEHICHKYGVDFDYILHCLKKRERPDCKGRQHYENLTHRYLAAIVAKTSGYAQTAEHITEEIKNL